jgi:hypothetical protein
MCTERKSLQRGHFVMKRFSSSSFNRPNECSLFSNVSADVGFRALVKKSSMVSNVESISAAQPAHAVHRLGSCGCPPDLSECAEGLRLLRQLILRMREALLGSRSSSAGGGSTVRCCIMFLRGFRDRRLSTPPPGETGGVMVGVPGSSISGIVTYNRERVSLVSFEFGCPKMKSFWRR